MLKSLENNRYTTLVDIFLKITACSYPRNSKILVVGAGKGVEVLALKKYFHDIVAIEPDYENVIEEAKPYVKAASATELAFPDGRFDIVYCYHVLEHISKYKKALSEMRRVLKKGGTLYLGVPNINRIIAYIFSAQNPLKDRIKWLVEDYKMKFAGKFKNSLGAHAGFAKEEIMNTLTAIFFTVEDKSDVYYLLKYKNNIIVRIITRLQFFKKNLWPSLYFICKK